MFLAMFLAETKPKNYIFLLRVSRVKKIIIFDFLFIEQFCIQKFKKDEKITCELLWNLKKISIWNF